jgi:hypothetical protein
MKSYVYQLHTKQVKQRASREAGAVAVRSDRTQFATMPGPICWMADVAVRLAGWLDRTNPPAVDI